MPGWAPQAERAPGNLVGDCSPVKTSFIKKANPPEAGRLRGVRRLVVTPPAIGVSEGLGTVVRIWLTVCGVFNIVLRRRRGAGVSNRAARHGEERKGVLWTGKTSGSA